MKQRIRQVIHTAFNILTKFWQYLSERQKLFLRCLHLSIALLVILQIISSNGMAFTPERQVSSDWFFALFTWAHIIVGITIFVLAWIFVPYCLFSRGLRYFYPYLWGDFVQLRLDIASLLRFEQPDSNPRGLAACVQGLGLGALVLVVGSGFIWFLLWRTGAIEAGDIKSLHKSLTALIELYLVAHGGMGLLHFFFWYRRQQR